LICKSLGKTKEQLPETVAQKTPMA